MRKAALVLRVITLAIAGPALVPPAKAAESVKVVVLASEQQVKQACATLPQVGVNCIPAGAPLDPKQLGAGSLPMSQADYSIFDRADRPKVRGFLILSPLTSPGGNVYYEATAKVFKTGFGGVGMTDTSLYDRQFWSNAGESLPLVTPDSGEVQQFVQRLDAEIGAQKEAAAKKEAAREAAAAQAASQAAYQASPQFAADQARARVENCKRQIQYARSVIDRDNQIAQISGYENKLAREQAAAMIVDCQHVIARGGRDE